MLKDAAFGKALLREQARKTALETLEILERGHYELPESGRIDIGQWQRTSEQQTLLYKPGEPSKPPAPVGRTGDIHITSETTLEAARRLSGGYRTTRIAVLNFASAKRPGGGFRNGAKAQEESLARSTGLYPTLLTQKHYYVANRRCGTFFYTDHLIYSPQVPCFRLDSGTLVPPFLVNFITSPAVNLAQVKSREKESFPDVPQALLRRARQILGVSADRDCDTLVLGAWGCGVFGNDPRMIANTFATLLIDQRMRYAFDHVCFAIADQKRGNNLRAIFESALQTEAPKAT